MYNLNCFHAKTLHRNVLEDKMHIKVFFVHLKTIKVIIYPDYSTLINKLYLLAWKLIFHYHTLTCQLIFTAPHSKTSLFCFTQSHPIKWSTFGQ